MATAKKQAAPTAGGSDKALKVYGKRDGFRRAGRVFGSEPVVIPLDQLTPEEYEAITSEPMLVAVEVDAEKPATA